MIYRDGCNGCKKYDEVSIIGSKHHSFAILLINRLDFDLSSLAVLHSMTHLEVVDLGGIEEAWAEGPSADDMDAYWDARAALEAALPECYLVWWKDDDSTDDESSDQEDASDGDEHIMWLSD